MAENNSEGYEVFGRLVDSAHQVYVADNMTWEWLGHSVVRKLAEVFAQTSLNRVPLSAYSNARGKETVLGAVAADTARLLGRVKHLEGVLREATTALSGLRDAVLVTSPFLEATEMRRRLGYTENPVGDPAAAKVAEACARARDVLKLLVPSPTTTPEGEKQ